MPPSKSSLFGSQTTVAVKPPKEKIIYKIDTAIYQIPKPPKLELSDSLFNTLDTEAEDILRDYFVNDKTLEENAIEQIKKSIILTK